MNYQPSNDVITDGNSFEILLLDIDGYSGPIDLLLQLAKDQKVDLVKISILQLARQYIEFVELAREKNIDLAADYLVMAAWLAYLKSRLLLPKQEEDEEISAQDMADALQFQLMRLEAMQEKAMQLETMSQLGRDFFARGIVINELKTETGIAYDVSLYDLLSSYGKIKKRNQGKSYSLPVYNLMSAEFAMERLEKMLGALPKKNGISEWLDFNSLLPEGLQDGVFRKSAIASTLVATLELVKQGKVEVKQDDNFQKIYIRNNSDKISGDAD